MKKKISFILLSFILSSFNYTVSAFGTYRIAAEDTEGPVLLPKPQQVSLSEQQGILDPNWILSYKSSEETDFLSALLKKELKDQHNLQLENRTDKKEKSIRLEIHPGKIPVGHSLDTNKSEIGKQAYRIELKANNIRIEANASQGLFYGIQTLLQLLKTQDGTTSFPTGSITDWPELQTRIIYWDDAHHLEHFEEFKRIIRQAAAFKINAIALKLEGHFEFEHAPAIVEPYAWSPQQYQELTNYARQYFVQIIPYLDAPAHVSFILKHPEYAHMREFSHINYEACIANPETFRLFFGMFDDLIRATQGSRYFLLSTDEAYYVGKSDGSGCNEKSIAQKSGGNGRLMAEFVTKASDYLFKKGRKSIFWGEFPLTKKDIPFLPARNLINGVYDSEVSKDFEKQGIPQMIYSSTQGVEPYFPNYYRLPDQIFSMWDDYFNNRFDTVNNIIRSDDENFQPQKKEGRIGLILKNFLSVVADGNSNLTGSIIAGWGDSGLHPETFWLGYVTGSAIAWNYHDVTEAELSKSFYRNFYGDRAAEMEKIYTLLSQQAEYWGSTWDWAPSKLRTPIMGNSEDLFTPPVPAKDQVLSLPAIPDRTDFSLNKDWVKENESKLKWVDLFLKENQQLTGLLNKNRQENVRNEYNLAVFQSIADLCRHNLEMFQSLRKINTLLNLFASTKEQPERDQISVLDLVLDEAHSIRKQRNAVYQSTVTTWYQSWTPRVEEANGRKYLFQVDDIKDHVPVRTIDMSYLIYRELNYPLGEWAEQILALRNDLALKANLPERNDKLNWKNLDL